MLFTRHTRPDGTEVVTVDRWGQEVPISQAFLDAVAPGILVMDEDVITLTVANGWARYQIVSRDERLVQTPTH